MSEIDPNTIISTVITQKIDQTVEALKGAFGDAVDKARAKLKIGYSEYVKRNYARCAQIKTILYRHTPVLLKQHYVSPDLQIGKRRISEDEIIRTFSPGSKLVVTGTAGSGKSLFMKNAYLEFVNQSKKFVPLFIELRALNEDPAKTLKAHIVTEVQQIAQAITEEFFDLGLRNGSFAFFLDGFDEIDYKQGRRIEKEILSLANAFPKCSFIVSSRPDDRFFSWQEFEIYRIMPMSKQQIVTLIKKIEYEEIVKSKFIARIEGGLYDNHREFLSNPLLATIMLLTFEQIADIPEKMHVFYQQAFETLFHRHDATKEMYKRERYTSYPVDEFRRYLGAFCLATYLDQRFSFDDSAARDYIKEAFELEGKTPSEQEVGAFLNDLLMSVCMLQRDGLEIQFSHRSFQEYFCASYVCGCDPGNVGKLLDEIVSRAFFDRTLALIRDMHPEIFDRHWTVPRLGQIMTKIGEIDPKNNPKDYIQLFCDQLVFHRDPGFIHFRVKGKMGRNWALMHFIYQLDNAENYDYTKEELYEKKIDIIKRNLGEPHKESPRVVYSISDLKPEMIRDLLFAEGRLDDRTNLRNLHAELKTRYARKDERMSELLAKAKRN